MIGYLPRRWRGLRGRRSECSSFFFSLLSCFFVFSYVPRTSFDAVRVPIANPFQRWSFGGNRLQIKAETHVLADVAAQLELVGKIAGAGGVVVPPDVAARLKAKRELLALLLANEQMRLLVWLFPLEGGKRHHFGGGGGGAVAKGGLVEVRPPGFPIPLPSHPSPL